MILVDLLSKVRFMGSLKAEQRRAPDTCLGVPLGIWLRRKHIHTRWNAISLTQSVSSGKTRCHCYYGLCCHFLLLSLRLNLAPDTPGDLSVIIPCDLSVTEGLLSAGFLFLRESLCPD